MRFSLLLLGSNFLQNYCRLPFLFLGPFEDLGFLCFPWREEEFHSLRLPQGYSPNEHLVRGGGGSVDHKVGKGLSKGSVSGDRVGTIGPVELI